MSKKVILSFPDFKRYAGSGSVGLIDFLTKQKIGKVEFTSKSWKSPVRTTASITKWVIDLQKGSFLKLVNGKEEYSEKQSVGELIGEIMDLISNDKSNEYSSIAVYRRTGIPKHESNINESLQTGDLPKIINDGWKSTPSHNTVPLEVKTINAKDLSKSPNPKEKKMYSAFKASLKYKVGYVIDSRYAVFPWGKYYMTDTMSIFYVYAIDSETVKITRFKIGDRISKIKNEGKLPMTNIQKVKRMIREAVLKENLNRRKRRISEAYGLHPDVISQYLETALWSSNDESDDSGGEPFDANYDISDIAPESIAKAKKDIEKFIDMAEEEGVLDPYLDAFTGPSWANLGHDFWLTRNRHGSGFWDRNEIEDEVGKKLSDISKKFKEVNPILGDDGKIYFE